MQSAGKAAMGDLLVCAVTKNESVEKRFRYLASGKLISRIHPMFSLAVISAPDRQSITLSYHSTIALKHAY